MATNAAEVRKLRTELEGRFGRAILPARPQPREGRGGLGTGVQALGHLLPEGVERGSLTLWMGETSSGRTAALRSLAMTCCAAGGTVAVVDAGRTLDASFACTAEGPIEGIWLVRPPDARAEGEAAWAAEALLRSGVFDLVVLDGCLLESSEAHRLRALARERDAALVVSAAMESGESGRSRSERQAFRPRSRRGRLRVIPSEQEGESSDAPADSLRSREESLASPTVPCSLFPVPSSLSFRPDVRVEFRRSEGGVGLRAGGRFRQRGRLRLVKGSSSALPAGEREVELIHEPANRMCPGSPIPDRSPGGR